MSNKGTMIVDTGSGMIKAGFAGDDAPFSIFPNQIGKPKAKAVMEGGSQKEIFVGNEINNLKGVLALE